MCSIQALKEAVNRLQSGSQEEMVDRRLVNKLLVRLPGVFTDEVLSPHADAGDVSRSQEQRRRPGADVTVAGQLVIVALPAIFSYDCCRALVKRRGKASAWESTSAEGSGHGLPAAVSQARWTSRTRVSRTC